MLTKLSRTINESDLFSASRKNPVKKEDQREFIDNGNDIFILKELKEQFIVERERLWYELDQEWDNIVKIHVDEQEPIKSNVRMSRHIDQTRLNTLSKFSHLNNSQHKLKSRSIAFAFFTKLKHLSAQFIRLCQLVVIGDGSQLLVNAQSTDDQYVYVTFVQHADQKSGPDQQLDFKLDQIEQLLRLLHEHVFKLTVEIITNGKSTSSEHLMSLFSDLTLEEFTNLIYEQLIVNVIPIEQFDFNIEARICTQIGHFEQKLKRIAYLKTNDDGQFKKFVSNVEELYVRKKCKYIMEKARAMMKNKQLIFELVRIDRPSTPIDANLVQDALRAIEKTHQTSNNSLDEANLLGFGECSISQLARDLVTLVDETLDEAYRLMANEHKKNIKNVSLICLIARNLFELYANIIPMYYSTNLRELPQLSAIIYNDLLYLSHNCLTLYHRYKHVLGNLRGNTKTALLNIEFIDLDDLINNFSFVDLVPKLCNIGFKLLNEQMNKQETILIEYLNENSNSLRVISESNNFDLVKKSLQKCIYQINNLSHVWANVLNRNVYFKLVGSLFDLVCNDLLKSCLKLEDIDNDNSNYLHMVFGVLSQSIIDLFARDAVSGNDNSDERLNENIAELTAAKYVISWNRFKYFMKILKANLLEIDEMWSEGKGPLALYFEPDEVRSLIRALFMNTDRRSAVLAKIREL